MSYSGYQSSRPSGPNDDFSKLAQTIANNVQKISSSVSHLQRMITVLGTQQDSEDFRTQLHENQHYTNQLARETNNKLKELANLTPSFEPSLQKQRRMQKEKLTSDFSEALKNFQIIQRTAAQKEKESVIRARANSHLDGSSNQSTLIDLQRQPIIETPPKIPSNLNPFYSPSGQQQQQQHQMIMMEEDVNLSMLRERETAIKKIESDIVEVNQIFKDLATMVHEQGDVIDSIEANIEAASVQIHEGTNQLAKASDYSQRARRKKCMLIFILLVIIGIIVMIVSLSN